MVSLMPLHLSKTAAAWLRALTAAFIVLWLVLLGGLDADHPAGFAPQLAWVLFGAAITLLLVMRNAAPPDEKCSFCFLPRANVRTLVAGPAVSICENCAPLCMSLIAEDF